MWKQFAFCQGKLNKSKASAIFWGGENRCVCLFSKSGCEKIDLPRGDNDLIVKKYLLA